MGAEDKRNKKPKPKATTTKKNQYEIWADFTESMAKTLSQETHRLKDLAKKVAPGKATYTVGDFLTDQLENATRLMKAYNEAAKKN